MPKVYIMAEETPNAFATGRNPEHAVVAVTQGIMRLFTREELTGVIAHELAHITASGHADRHHSCHNCRRDQHVGTNGTMGNDLRRRQDGMTTKEAVILSPLSS